MKTLKLPMLAVAALTATMLHATEYFVDCTKSNDKGDGLTEATAKRTIQAAVDAAASGDTVTVLPGTYAEGGKVVDYACTQPGYEGQTLSCTNRVWISKGLTLRAKNPNQLTEIVGAWDTTSGSDMGSGPAAVRCVMVETAEKVIIRGFTIRDGSSQDDETRVKNDFWPTVAGGVARSFVTYNNFYVVDCTIRHCGGCRGAGMRGGWAIRCQFYGIHGSMLHSANGLHSVFARQAETDCAMYVFPSANLYSCSVFLAEGSNGSDAYLSLGGNYVNTIVTDYNRLTSSGGKANVTNCYMSVASHGIGEKYASEFELSGSNARPFCSTIGEDWRLRADWAESRLGEAAYIAALDLPDEVEKMRPLRGAALPETGTILPGAVQETFTPSCGAILVKSDFASVDGVPTAGAVAYFYSEDPRAQYRLTVTPPEGQYLHSWNTLIPGSGYNRFPTLNDESVLVLPPKLVSETSENTPYFTSVAYWVSPSGDDDATGAAGAPFETLIRAAQAVSNAVEKNGRAVVFAAPGLYATKSEFSNKNQSRVVDYGRAIRFVGAGAYGENKSIIRGSYGTTLTCDCGEGAVRCASFDYHSCLQGFRLEKGRTVMASGNDASCQGAGMYCINAANAQVVDSHFYDCASSRGMVIYNGQIVRCRVSRCDAFAGARMIEGTSYAYACLIDDLVGANCNITDGGAWMQCTFAKSQYLIGSGSKIFNSVSETPVNNPSMSWNFDLYGLVCAYSSCVPKTPASCHIDLLAKDPQFIDSTRGDWRLRSTSPAIGYGAEETPRNTADADHFWRTLVGDVNGNKILFFGGKPLPGAVQEIAQVVTIAETPYATYEPAGPTIFMSAGATQTISIVKATRPPVAMVAGGVTNTATSVSIVAPALPAGTIAVEALFGTNWYVNANMPNDDGDGFTPATAKKTLVGIFTNQYLAAGDVVHAAAGDYNEGTTKSKAGSTIFERVVMKAGTTLVADEGPEVTFISGADAPEGQRETYGKCTTLGIGATRAVYMKDNTVLRGFTVRLGRTRGIAKDFVTDTDNYAGGVMAAGGVSSLIEDCIVYSNASRRAGAGSGGTWRRCKFLWNMNDVCNDYQGFGGFYNCYFNNNDSYVQTFPMVNCCIGPNGSANYAIYAAAGSKIINTICYKSVRLTSGGTGLVLAPTNCVFTGWTVGGEAGAGKTIDDTLIVKKTAAEINQEFDLNMLTITNKGFLVDTGNAVALSYSKLGDTDINGSQRVYNAALDIGPVEYDWRGDYAAALGAEEVTSASPEVKLTAGKVRLTDGAALCFKSSAKCNKLPFEIVDGTLTVGDREYDKSGVCKFRSPAALALSFAGVDGYADLGKLLEKPGMIWFAK